MLDSFRELLDGVVKTPQEYKAAIEGVGDLAEADFGDEWNAAQVMAHMTAVEALWLSRLNVMINEDEPRLKGGIAPEIVEIQTRLMPGKVADNLEEFNNSRGEMVSLLMGLSLRDWERKAHHDNLGEITIADVVEKVMDHDADHLQQIQNLDKLERK